MCFQAASRLLRFEPDVESSMRTTPYIVLHVYSTSVEDTVWLMSEAIGCFRVLPQPIADYHGVPAMLSFLSGESVVVYVVARETKSPEFTEPLHVRVEDSWREYRRIRALLEEQGRGRIEPSPYSGSLDGFYFDFPAGGFFSISDRSGNLFTISSFVDM